MRSPIWQGRSEGMEQAASIAEQVAAVCDKADNDIGAMVAQEIARAIRVEQAKI